MTIFWLAGVLLAAAVLLLVLRPLLRRHAVTTTLSTREANIAIYRDQLRELDADLRTGVLAPGDYERARRELEARLLEDASGSKEPARAAGGRRLAWALGAGIPVFALGIYLAVGNPAAFSPGDQHSITARELEGMVERLAARLREQPDDVEGWKLLGRSYAVLGRFAESA